MAKKKAATKAERHHMNKVAALGCIACRVIGYEDTPAELHHIRAGAGAGQRGSHYRVIPLCSIHHRTGYNAFHKSKKDFEACFGTEEELLTMVMEEV